MPDHRFRLVTRSDFDGVVCAVLFEELDMIDRIKFVHPKDMQDGTILIADDDISTNLPYAKGVHLAFDHHVSERLRLDKIPANYVVDPMAPSAAHVVYDHFGGQDAFPRVSEALMAAVDKSDSGQFDTDDIVAPKGWVLLNYLLDARTGLGRFHHFRISNYDLMLALVEACRTQDVDSILAMPDVAERVALYHEQAPAFCDQLQRCTSHHGAVAVIDLRRESMIHAGNRFMIYALFPQTMLSIHIFPGLEGLNTVLAVGKSVLHRGATVNIGELMLKYGGGGHQNAGTCQVANKDADRIIAALIERIGMRP